MKIIFKETFIHRLENQIEFIAQNNPAINWLDPVILNLFQYLINGKMLKQVQHDVASIVC
jgi:hypothetical protein